MAKPANIEAIERATGRTWDDWLRFMNEVGAADLSHKDLAEKVESELSGKVDNPGWWAQSATVAYEQHIGRRAPGQSQDGTFQLSVSKATQLSMQELMDDWTEFARADDEVLEMIAADEPRVSGTAKRINWRVKGKDGADIRVTSEPKKNGTASLIATHMKLESHEKYAAARDKWARILERFVTRS